MLIRKAAHNGVMYDIKRRYTPQDGVPLGPQDEMKVYVLDVVEEGAADPELDVRKVRCSIEAQAWHAAARLSPTDNDLELFYADRIADDLPRILVCPTGDKYIPLFIEMNQYVRWEQHLGTRRAGSD